MAASTLLAASPSGSAETSENISPLWGREGELWSPTGNLPDFSWAGYHSGAREIPTLPPGKSVKDFGAVGDGTTDDTAAFLKALAEVEGAIEVPAGRYVISNILEMKRSGVVLRGEGADNSVLVFPVPLDTVKPNWGATTGGARTSNYSWSGGFVWMRGDLKAATVTKITKDGQRGDTTVSVGGTSKLTVGQQIMVQVKDTEANTLAEHLYSGDPGPMDKLNGRTHGRLICRITAIEGKVITLDRPLRFDLRAEWEPVVKSLAPTVTECGVEGLGFEFPPTPYGGHFSELGQNAVAMQGVMNCWVRDIAIQNPDSGIFVSGTFCTVSGVTVRSERAPDEKGYTGHHGIYIGNDDNLFTGFDFQTKFIHDLSVSHCAGNVMENGRGVDLSFDHHKRTPYENLYTNLEAGLGTRLWMSGGGADLGKHCAGRGTFWNIRTERPVDDPPEHFGPATLNVVGLRKSKEPQATVPPQNLREAQLQRRLSAK